MWKIRCFRVRCEAWARDGAARGEGSVFVPFTDDGNRCGAQTGSQGVVWGVGVTYRRSQDLTSLLGATGLEPAARRRDFPGSELQLNLEGRRKPEAIVRSPVPPRCQHRACWPPGRVPGAGSCCP